MVRHCPTLIVYSVLTVHSSKFTPVIQCGYSYQDFGNLEASVTFRRSSLLARFSRDQSSAWDSHNRPTQQLWPNAVSQGAFSSEADTASLLDTPSEELGLPNMQASVCWGSAV